ncbi:MAG: MFS transporter [Pseudomonadota bacterium]
MLAGVRISISEGLGGRVFYGWVMVAAATLIMFSSGPGQSHTFAAFNALIAEDLGLTLLQVTLAYGVATTIAAFLLPVFGRQLERFGPRRALAVNAVALGVACLFFGAIANIVWLGVGFAALRFVGQGCTMMGAANLVAQWFVVRRGFAMGIVAVGFALSIGVHPALAKFLIAEVGWRQAWVGLGLITWVSMLPVIWLLIRDKPEDMGLKPDGGRADPGDGPAPALTGATRAEALRSLSFWICAAGLFLIAGMATTLHYHQYNILEAQGLSTVEVTQGFFYVAMSMLVFMPLVGRGFDRFRTRYMFAAALLVQASTMVGITFVSDYTGMVIYALAFGLNNAFSITMMGYMWPRYFGRKHLGSIQGTGQMIGVIGASVGALPVSYAIDQLGDPAGMMQVLAILPVICAVVAVIFLKTLPQVEEAAHLD